MKKKNIFSFYQKNREKIRLYLIGTTIFSQAAGFLLNSFFSTSNIGMLLMTLGALSGLLLISQTNSLKEAFLNVAYALFTIPICVVAMILSVYGLGVVMGGFNLNSFMKLTDLAISFAFLSMLILYTAWPLYVGPLGLKYVLVKLKKPKN